MNEALRIVVVAPDLADLGCAVVGEYLTARFRGDWRMDDWE